MSRSSTRHRRFLPALSALVLAPVVLAVSPASASAHHVERLTGHWRNDGPCTITSAKPDLFHPGALLETCVGSATWSGALTGVMHYRSQGSVNALTGHSNAMLTETFTGVAAASGKPGTIHLSGTTAQNGKARTMTAELLVTSGTGAFAGVDGHLRYFGAGNSLVASGGHYKGAIN
jgi:Protein of unknown function (DUF3224)